MISDEAVEAGAEISFRRHGAKYYSPLGAWAELEPRFRTAWLEDARRILEAAAPYMLTRLTNAVINRAYEDGRLAALEEAAAEAEAVIALGDVAECAAHVPGERGRSSAVSARDALHEDPVAWLRRFATPNPYRSQA